MDRTDSKMTPRPGRPAARLAGTALVLAFAAACVGPYLARLRYPSLYSDDVVRVAQLQVMPLRAMLFRPFNEHLAPLFEAVSWTTWQLAGQRLVAAPLAFTAASILPFLLIVPLLARVLRRELASTTTALVATACFSISALYVETVLWYSASSFAWALLATLVAFSAAGRTIEGARSRDRAFGWIGSAIATASAPAFSAIGLLAAPLALVRVLAATGRPARWPVRLIAATAPAAGLAVYLGVVATFGYREVVAQSMHQNADFRLGLASVARAPIDVLLPGLVGLPNIDARLPRGLDLALAAVGLAGLLAWSIRSRFRPLILGGLVLIVGGYGLTYCVRTVHGPHWILEVQRYHLFPQLGLALVLGPALVPVLRRFDGRPVRALAVATALAVVLGMLHAPEFRTRARYYRFPEQPRTLAALERLATTCRDAGITREQALAALDPIRTRWFDHDFNALTMLAPTVPAPRLPDNRVRSILLGSLSDSEREALCGGMDASPHLRPAAELGATTPLTVGRLVQSFRVRSAGPEGHYVAAGRPSYLEFEISNLKFQTSEPPRALCVPGGGSLEIWWADESGKWSETRSVRWRTDPARSPEDWSIPIDRLPHWGPDRGPRRVRVAVQEAGPVAVGAPKLLR